MPFKRRKSDEELKKAHDALNILAKELEAKVSHLSKMDKIKSDFIANISHEIKTPLTSIMGFVETLENGALKDAAKAERFLSIIKKNTENITNLTNKLLNLSELELGTEKIRKQEFDLRELASEVISGFAVAVSEKGVSMELEGTGKVFIVNADRDKLKQVLQNLLDNTIKYGREGGQATLFIIEKENEFIIDVEDDGIGIAEEHLDMVFERFYRTDKSRSRAIGGTGLGLSIVKQIILLHGGYISIKSMLNQGTKIVVSLPR
jgi:signal transduction histidine kinase